MSDLIKKIKIKKQDGTFTDYIPIGAEAQNVSTSDGDSVQLKLNKKPYYYNSIAEMKADTKLKAGDMVKTLGYYEPNDGGGANYYITDNINNNAYQEQIGSLYAELITNTYNVKMFGAKGDGLQDDSSYIQKAINTLRKFAVNNNDLSKVYTLYFPNGDYRVDNQIELSPLVKINTIGFVVITSYVLNDSTLFLNPKEDDLDDNISQSYVRDWYSGSYINGNNGLLIRFNGNNNANTTGLEIGNREFISNNKGFMLSSIKNININNFENGIKFNLNNIYCDTIENYHSANKNCIIIGTDGISQRNSGERITFKDCQLGNGIDIYDPINLNFINCSFDFSNHLFYSPNGKLTGVQIYCNECWFEGMSYQITDEDVSNNVPHGILFLGENTQFSYLILIIKNSQFILTNGKQLFISKKSNINPLVILENIHANYNLNVNEIMSQPKNRYMGNDNVFMNVKNWIPYGKQGNFPSHNLNSNSQPNFDGLSLGSIDITNGVGDYTFRYKTNINNNAEIITSSITNKNCLKLTPSNINYGIALISDYIPVRPGQNIKANGVYTGFNSFRCTIFYYDINKKEISNTGNYIYFQDHDINMDYINPYLKDEIIPERCSYIKISFEFDNNKGTLPQNGFALIHELIAQLN